MAQFIFKPANTYTDRHGLFIGLVGPTNSGKTYSALRLARGIAGKKRIAVGDTEAGRTLHLKKEFDFDFTMMDPPHRPARYLQLARDAQDAGYGCLVIDTWTNEWRGIGGVLDWMDEEMDAIVERERAYAKQKNYSFDEGKTRFRQKSTASIRPKMAHKLMMSGLLGLRIPIIFATRGEMTYDPEAKEERFKAQCSPGFLFEVTVSFRLASDKKGVIDLSDPASWKMEGSHRDIFKNGEQLSERHGELLEAWATGAPLPNQSGSAMQPKQQRQPLQEQPSQQKQADPSGQGLLLGDAPAGWQKPASLNAALTEIEKMTPEQAKQWSEDALGWMADLRSKQPAAAEKIQKALFDKLSQLTA